MDDDAAAGWVGRDEAVTRLEDHLLRLPYDRALPDLTRVLADAGVDPELLGHDERARKIVHEAILARPLADVGEVAARTAEVQLLVLEVSVLTDDLRAGGARDADEPTRQRAAAARERLATIRKRLAELRDGL